MLMPFAEIKAGFSPDAALIVDMFFALFLGFLFGYERSYHGRAAGVRTYGLVCMVSAALTSVSAHPAFWLGGAGAVNSMGVDATRTVQGIMTGVGFLGAGIIMKDGMRISGLTTAASIWASAAIGILVGFEFYLAALVMTLMAELFVLLGSRFDMILPSRRPIFISLRFGKDFHPHEDTVLNLARKNGYEVARGSVAIQSHAGSVEWRFVAVSINKRQSTGLAALADSFSQIEGVESFQVSRARN